MNNPNNFSRLDRKKKRKDKLLNVLIAVVVVAIVITASIIFLGGDKEQSDEEEQKNNEEIVEQNKVDDSEEATLVNDEEVVEGIDTVDEDAESDEAGDVELDEVEDVEITVDPNDPIVSQSIVDPAWEPIGTEQSGEHVSVYNKNSVDWKEKEQALTYATGVSADNMIIWKLKNGGSPQKSIGIISTKDKSEMYRVFLEWVDNEGWKPVEMDVLTTLDFD